MAATSPDSPPPMTVIFFNSNIGFLRKNAVVENMLTIAWAFFGYLTLWKGYRQVPGNIKNSLLLEMQTEVKNKRGYKDLSVLLVGNNPIELSKVFDNIRHVSGARVLTEIAFDIKTIFERLVDFRPNYILIDDNIGKGALKTAVKMLGRDRKTKDIPIAVLKNSNYEEVFSVGVMDYILKENINGQSLYTALSNSLKFRRTQLYLYKTLKKRKGQLKRLARG